MFYDGTAAEYFCGAAALDEPSCALADTEPQQRDPRQLASANGSMTLP